MKISIITTLSEDREEYYTCLKERLMGIFEDSGHSLSWFVQTAASFDSSTTFVHSYYLEKHSFVKCNGDLFPKASLLNFGIEEAKKQDFDRLVMLDVDLLPSDNFLKIIEGAEEKSITFLGGYKLQKDFSDSYLKGSHTYQDIGEDAIDQKSIGENYMERYIGNICLTRYSFGVASKYMNPLYDPRFVGFGGEDNVISFLSRDLSRKGILARDYKYDAWYHLWHERHIDSPSFDKKQYDKNIALFKEIVEENRKKIKKDNRKS